MNKLALAAALLLATTSAALAQGAEPVTTTTTTTTVVSPAPVVVTQPGTVVAAPATAAAPVGGQPEQTHAWKDVNHVNGQLVKVGETNEYLKGYKRWNVSTNPVGMILGFYGVSVSYGINQNIAIRGDVNYMKPPGNDSVTGFEVGVGAPIYFKRTYQGLFLEPGLISRTFSDTACNNYDANFECSSTSEVTSTTFGPQMLVGWHWTWDSGLNFAVAAGAGRDWSTKDSDSYDTGVFANGYMRFGYAFN